MSEMKDDEIVATKLNNGSMSIYGLLDYWYMKYGIDEYQKEVAEKYIMKLEGKELEDS